MGILQDYIVPAREPPPPPEPQRQAQQFVQEATDDTIGGGFSDSTEATAEEQDAKDRVVEAGLAYIFDGGKPTESVVGFLKAQGRDPAKALATTTATVVKELDRKSKGMIPEAAILPAAGELLENVAELASTARLFPVDEAVLHRATQLLVQDLWEEYDGDPESLKAMMDSIPPEQQQEIADQQGGFARKQPTPEMFNGKLPV